MAHGFDIVGIGASAGGLVAFKELVAHLTSTSNKAFVLIQHMDPTFKTLLPEILATNSRIKIIEITHGMSIQENALYVCPSYSDVEVCETFQLKPCKPSRHANIDCLFTSISKIQGSQCVGVVLSGMLNDGSKGITAIKQMGGVTFAQSPETAKYPSMPASAIQTGNVDFVLCAGEIGRMLSIP